MMQHMSRESFGAYVLVLMVVGICYRSDWRMGWEMVWGISAFGMFAYHLACLLSRRSRPYDAELNAGRVRMKEYGHVRSWEDITSVVLVTGSSSSSGQTG